MVCARASRAANACKTRGVRRVATANDHDRIDLRSDLDRRILTLTGCRADCVLNIGVDAAFTKLVDHGIEGGPLLGCLDDYPHRIVHVIGQVVRRRRHDNAGRRLGSTSGQALHLGVPFLADDHDAAMLFGKLICRFLRSGNEGARRIENVLHMRFNVTHDLRGDAMASDDDRVVRISFGNRGDLIDSCLGKLTHHDGIMDQGTQRMGAREDFDASRAMSSAR